MSLRCFLIRVILDFFIQVWESVLTNKSSGIKSLDLIWKILSSYLHNITFNDRLNGSIIKRRKPKAWRVLYVLLPVEHLEKYLWNSKHRAQKNNNTKEFFFRWLAALDVSREEMKPSRIILVIRSNEMNRQFCCAFHTVKGKMGFVILLNNLFIVWQEHYKLYAMKPPTTLLKEKTKWNMDVSMLKKFYFRYWYSL